MLKVPIYILRLLVIHLAFVTKHACSFGEFDVEI